MKEYVKPEVILVSFESENVTDRLELGTEYDDLAGGGLD